MSVVDSVLKLITKTPKDPDALIPMVLIKEKSYEN
jgi:hypothetical protein